MLAGTIQAESSSDVRLIVPQPASFFDRARF